MRTSPPSRRHSRDGGTVAIIDTTTAQLVDVGSGAAHEISLPTDAARAWLAVDERALVVATVDGLVVTDLDGKELGRTATGAPIAHAAMAEGYVAAVDWSDDDGAHLTAWRGPGLDDLVSGPTYLGRARARGLELSGGGALVWGQLEGVDGGARPFANLAGIADEPTENLWSGDDLPFTPFAWVAADAVLVGHDGQQILVVDAAAARDGRTTVRDTWAASGAADLALSAGGSVAAWIADDDGAHVLTHDLGAGAARRRGSVEPSFSDVQVGVGDDGTVSVSALRRDGNKGYVAVWGAAGDELEQRAELAVDLHVFKERS